MIIDAYTHILPKPVLLNLPRVAPNQGNMGKRVGAVPALHDLDERFRQMDPFGDYRQIISLPGPPLEEVCSSRDGSDMARLANDAMAELVRSHRDRFAGFVACINMLDLDSAYDETVRASSQLGAVGVQIYSNVAGKPLDDPQIQKFLDAVAIKTIPMWLHPTRTSTHLDYASEARSRFEMWWSLGWPYETSAAMIRLILSGIFDRHPNVKIMAHHLGGIIPFVFARTAAGLAQLGARTVEEDYGPLRGSFSGNPADYVTKFLVDTANFGDPSALRCGLNLYTANGMAFATDAPFMPIDAAFRAMERLEFNQRDQLAIYKANIERFAATTFD